MKLWSSVAILALGTSALPQAAQAQCQSWDPTVGNPGLGTGISYLESTVKSLTWLDDGSGPRLYAGGNFSASGSVPMVNLARLDPSGWTPVGSLVPNSGPLYGIFGYDDGSGPALFVAAQCSSSAGGVIPGIAKWDGQAFTPLGSGTQGTIYGFAAFDDGSGRALYISGGFYDVGGVAGTRAIARWNGTTWSSAGLRGINWAGDMTVFDDGSGPALFVIIGFQAAGGLQTSTVAKWNGTTWTNLGVVLTGFNWYLGCMAWYDDGTGPALYVGGNFASIGGVPAKNIARWNGSTWSALGQGLDAVPRDLVVFDDGSGAQLYVGGDFSLAGGQPCWHIARWNGSTWSGILSGITGPVHTLLPFDDGSSEGQDLYLGGDFFSADGIYSRCVAEWHGCAAPGTNFCDGDGSVMPCPCGNSGAPGYGCMNSTGLPANLASAGSVLPDTLRLTASAEPATAVTIFLQGDLDLSPGVNFGDGLRCTGGTLKRLYVKNAVSGTVQAPGPGDLAVHDVSANLGDPLAPGSTRYYQAYYRDGDPSFCPAPQGSSFNVTNGVKIVW